jgi:peroxiredoxin
MLLTVCLPLLGGPTEPSKPAANPSQADEGELIRQIRKLHADREADPVKSRSELRLLTADDLLPWVENLLTRFPASSFRDDALVIKLELLAELARYRPESLNSFMTFLDEISAGAPTGRLAEEHAFFAIQGFVLGARRENMADDRRLLGTSERYQAFLEDYPRSPRRPIVWASLIRNLIAMRQSDRAQSELDRLQREFPDHSATRRARGEVSRLQAVGKPYHLTYQVAEGRTIRSEDYLGKVLIVHFWASWSPRAVQELAMLNTIHDRFKEQGLQLIGVNVDTLSAKARECLERNPMPWPQYFDFKGFENPVLIDAGVTDVPTYFVVDRAGILRALDPGEGLQQLVEELLRSAEP